MSEQLSFITRTPKEKKINSRSMNMNTRENSSIFMNQNPTRITKLDRTIQNDFSRETMDPLKDFKKRESHIIDFSTLNPIFQKSINYDKGGVNILNNPPKSEKDEPVSVNYKKFAEFKNIPFNKIFHSYILRVEGNFENEVLIGKIEDLKKRIKFIKFYFDIGILMIIVKNTVIFVKILKEDFEREIRDLEDSENLFDMRVYFDENTIDSAEISRIPEEFKKYIHVIFFLILFISVIS